MTKKFKLVYDGNVDWSTNDSEEMEKYLTGYSDNDLETELYVRDSDEKHQVFASEWLSWDKTSLLTDGMETK